MKNLKQKIRNCTGAGLIGLGLAGLVGGCNEQLADSLVQTAWHQTTVSAIDSTIRNEIEGPRGSTTYVNVPAQSNTGNNTESQNSHNNPPIPQIYSTEIYNLDRNEKEDIEIYGGPTFMDKSQYLEIHRGASSMNMMVTNYLFDKIRNESFPEKGYKIIQRLNETPIRIEIVNKKIAGNDVGIMNQKGEWLAVANVKSIFLEQ
jgi:hypothetical protein